MQINKIQRQVYFQLVVGDFLARYHYGWDYKLQSIVTKQSRED